MTLESAWRVTQTGKFGLPIGELSHNQSFPVKSQKLSSLNLNAPLEGRLSWHREYYQKVFLTRNFHFTQMDVMNVSDTFSLRKMITLWKGSWCKIFKSIYRSFHCYNCRLKKLILIGIIIFQNFVFPRMIELTIKRVHVIVILNTSKTFFNLKLIPIFSSHRTRCYSE